MRIEGPAKRISIYVGETDTWHGAPLAHAIVQRAREMGMAGATVLRGVEGFGAHSRLHSARLLALSTDLPLLVEIVDRPDQVDAFLPELDEMVREGLVTVENVEVIHYRHCANDRNRRANP
ncbi:MAG: DUF190 domain-containing protein [Ignavibacteriales bacterium]